MIFPVTSTSARRKIDGVWHVVDRRSTVGIDAEWSRIALDRREREEHAARSGRPMKAGREADHDRS